MAPETNEKLSQRRQDIINDIATFTEQKNNLTGEITGLETKVSELNQQIGDDATENSLKYIIKTLNDNIETKKGEQESIESSISKLQSDNRYKYSTFCNIP